LRPSQADQAGGDLESIKELRHVIARTLLAPSESCENGRPRVIVQKVEQHIPVLDAIRGVAILLVLLVHIGENIPVPQSQVGRFLMELAQSAWVGVDLFFVLSGFLITGILYDTRETSNFFRSFYARRFLRIFPLYYGYLFFLIALTRPLHIQWHGRQWLYLFYLQNTGLVRHVTSSPLSPYAIVGHLWSLAVEEQFYFLWPLVVFLVKDRSRLIQIAGSVILGALLLRLAMLGAHMPHFFIYAFTLARADSLMIGAVVALLYRGGSTMQWRLKVFALWALPVSVPILVWMWVAGFGLSWDSGRLESIGFTTIAAASAAILILSLTSPRFEGAANLPVLRWLGKYSYGIYVLHLPAVLCLMNSPLGAGFLRSHPGAIWGLIPSLAGETVGIGLAYLSFRFYESRFLRLKRFFRYDFGDAGKTQGVEFVPAVPAGWIEPPPVQEMESR
jgi:peptidoglycan/LPS O-acetylase OafA/YrhL